MYSEKSRLSGWGLLFLSVLAIFMLVFLQVSVVSHYISSFQRAVIDTTSKLKHLKAPANEEEIIHALPRDELENHGVEDGKGTFISSESLDLLRTHTGENGAGVLVSLESLDVLESHVDKDAAGVLNPTETTKKTEKATVVPPNQKASTPRKIILWTSWRSGSTFLGDLLAKAEPELTFYSFEPLYNLGMEVFSDPHLNKTQVALRLTHDLLLCDLSQQQSFVSSNAALHFPLAANPFFFHRCAKEDKCSDTQFFSETCVSAHLHVAKIVRLSLKFARQLLLDPDMADLQIVYLVRDPRPVMRSRLAAENRRWCQPNTEDCSNPAHLCNLLEDDLQHLPQLLHDFPDRFFFLKYEDLSLNASAVIHQLWDALHIPITDWFVEYLNKTTRGEKPKEQRINTSRQTQQHTFEWRNTIEWPLVETVQSSCPQVIEQLGWRFFNTEEELRNVSLCMDND